MLSILEELRFWTGIMRDHGEFILTSLSFNEQEAIKYANYYKGVFSELHERAMKVTISDENAINVIYTESLNVLPYFIGFKKALLRRHLECSLSSSLPPTFYNHMINEAMDFYKTLLSKQEAINESKLTENLNMLVLWLVDAEGHAASIANRLDPAEKILIEEARKFEKHFGFLNTKAQELCKMLIRTELDDGILSYLNEEAAIKITEFICYLEKIRELRGKCRILGVLMPIVPDHMIREEKHFLAELSAVQAMK